MVVSLFILPAIVSLLLKGGSEMRCPWPFLHLYLKPELSRKWLIETSQGGKHFRQREQHKSDLQAMKKHGVCRKPRSWRPRALLVPYGDLLLTASKLVMRGLGSWNDGWWEPDLYCALQHMHPVPSQWPGVPGGRHDLSCSQNSTSWTTSSWNRGFCLLWWACFEPPGDSKSHELIPSPTWNLTWKTFLFLIMSQFRIALLNR